MIIGKDPWMRCTGIFKPCRSLLQTPHNMAICSIAGIVDQGNSCVWDQGWKTASQVDIQRELGEKRI